MSEKKDCGNCTNQLSGFDGGFFGVPLTCECKIYGDTENRKNCKEYVKRVTRNDLLMGIYELEKENEQLHQKNTKLISKIDFLERVIDGDV